MSGFAHKLPVPMECRDTDQLPLQKHVSRKAAGLLGASAMLLGAIAIAIVAAAFYVFNDLKVQDVQVSGTQLSGFSCQSISKINAQYDHRGPAYQAFTTYIANSFNGTNWVIKSGIDYIQYAGVFPTIQACYDASGNPSCTYDVAVSYGFLKATGTCNLTTGGEISVPVYFGNYSINNNGLTTFDLTFASNAPNVINVLQAAAAFYSPSIVCAPYAFNPPYLCTRMVRLSSLQIAAQSLSIGSSVHAGWLMIGAFLLGLLSKHCWKETPDTPEPTYHAAAPAAAPSATSVVTVELAAKPISVEGATENPVATSTDA